MEAQIVDKVLQNTTLQARQYQRRIVTKTLQMFNGTYINGRGLTDLPSKSIMIESPTGSGKTSMALLACKAMQEQIPDLVIGWVAMRRNLLGQAARENQSKKINVQNISFVSMFDKHPAEVAKARKDGKKILLVCDESQHDAASSMAHLHNLIQPDYVLGMTATPFRTDRMKLCFDKVIKDAGIHQLIQDGYLSKFDHYTIDDWKPETVAKHYCADPDKWGKSIFYFVNLGECFAMQAELAAAGHDSEVVTGDSDCEAQLERFRDGSIRCLINCMKLTEGFDEPSLHTAWVRDSGKGCTMQMGGRAFRKHPDLPVKNIVQSKNTRWPFIKTALPVIQYVWQNDEWASLQVNPMINQINHNTRMAIASTDVSIPKFVTERQSKKFPAQRLRFN